MILRVLAGIVFLLAGTGKLLEQGPYLSPILFKEWGSQWRTLVFAAELTVPWVELITGTAFIIGRGVHSARWIALGLCGTFATVLLVLPAGTQCNCFGLFGGLTHRWLHVAVVVALAFAVWRSRRERGDPR